MYHTIRDPQADMRFLDEHRRFFFKADVVKGLVETRRGELVSVLAKYDASIDEVLKKHDLTREKALVRLQDPRFQFGAQVTEELAGLVRAAVYRAQMLRVIESYDTLLSALGDTSLIGIGTILGSDGVDVVSVTTSEYRILHSTFDQKAWEAAVGDPSPAPHVQPMGVSTMVGGIAGVPRRHPVGIPGYAEADPILDVASLKE